SRLLARSDTCRWTWTFALMGSSSAAGGEQADQRGRGVPPNGVVDEALLAPALHEARAAENVEVMRQRRPRHFHRLLNLAGGHLPPFTDQEEKHLKPGEMGQSLEGLDVLLGRLKLRQGERGSLCHASRYIKI